MENKQTAVEWLVNQLEEHLLSENIKIDLKNTEAYEIADALFQQQIEEAYNGGVKFTTEWVLNKAPNLQKPSDYFTKTYQNGKDS